MAERKPDDSDARGIHQPDRGLHLNQCLFVLTDKFLQLGCRAFVDPELFLGVEPDRKAGFVQQIDDAFNFHCIPPNDGSMPDDGL